MVLRPECPTPIPIEPIRYPENESNRLCHPPRKSRKTDQTYSENYLVDNSAGRADQAKFNELSHEKEAAVSENKELHPISSQSSVSRARSWFARLAFLEQ